MREVSLSIFGSVGFCQRIQGNAKRSLLFSGCMQALEPDYVVRWPGSFEFKNNNCISIVLHSESNLVGTPVQQQIHNLPIISKSVLKSNSINKCMQIKKFKRCWNQTSERDSESSSVYPMASTITLPKSNRASLGCGERAEQPKHISQKPFS